MITSIRYINLDHDHHRRFYLQELFQDVAYPIIRQPGILIGNIQEDVAEYIRHGFEEYLEIERIPGVTGCWIAHIKALESIKERNGISVIIEDDFVFSEMFFEKALSMIESFKFHYDIIIFDPWGEGPISIHKVSNQIYQTKGMNYPYYGGTHCLFINNESVDKILKAKNNRKVMDYDGFILSNQEISSYVFYTGQSGTRNFPSNIHPQKEKANEIDLPSTNSFLVHNKSNYFHRNLEKEVVRVPPEVLYDITGIYQSQQMEDMRISFKTDGLALTAIQLWNNEKISFSPISELIYVSIDFPLAINFIRSHQGNFNKFSVLGNNLWLKVR